MTATTLLLVDDDVAVLRACARGLEARGYQVQAANDGVQALACLEKRAFDVILSDIEMPNMNGLLLLERIRAFDLDVPVIFLTGNPSVETAVQAIEHGALRYLVKPVQLKELTRVVDLAARLGRLAKAKRQAIEMLGGSDRLIGDQAGFVASFGRAMQSFYIAYQPIISWPKKEIFAYEALLRSREPSLPTPLAVIEAAERLGRLKELGKQVRDRATAPFCGRTDGLLLFVNLHPSDLSDEELFQVGSPLSTIADRVVLEVTERQSLHGIRDARGQVKRLRALGYRVAVDDLGAGFAGLESFALLEPDIVKLDMCLVRNIHQDKTKEAIVRTMIELCRELGIAVIAEGIESVEERDKLDRLGCELMQGYLFAKPAEGLTAPVY